MTVASTVAKSGPYAGAGTTGPFTVGFRFLDNSHLRVVKTDANGVDTTLVLDTDYTVSGAGMTTGAVTLTDVLAAGLKLTIVRSVPATQEADYVQNDAFPAESHETALDKLTMLVQQSSEAIDRSIKIGVADSPLTPLAGPSARANQLLGFGATGDNALFPITASVGAGDMRLDVFVGGTDFTAGVTTQLTLSRAPGNPDNLEVFFDGFFQGPDNWSVAGQVLTFNSAIPVGVTRVYARTGTTLSTSIPPAGSVSDAQIVWTGILNRVVGSIAALKALDTARYDRAFVTGFYASGDGGGGDYWFDSASAVAEVPGVIVAPNSGSGRWKLIFTGVLTTKQTGAKLDDSTDDRTAIQAAVDYVLAQPGGGAVRHPAGTSRIGGSITIPLTMNKSFSLLGDGAMSRFRATGAFHMFDIGGASPVFGANVLLRDWSIVQGTGGSPNGVRLRNVNSPRLEGLDISNADYGVLMEASYNVRISGCRFYGCGQAAISTLTTGTNGTYIFNNAISTCGVGINLLVGGNNNVIRDNDIEACTISIGMADYTSILIEGNYMEGNPNTYFVFDGTNYEIDIKQNWFGINGTNTDFHNIIGGSFIGNTVWGSNFTQNTANLRDFIIGHNIVQNSGSIPATFWTVPTLINGFSNVGAGNADAGYIKDRDGMVHLRGLIQAGADNAAFVLPLGYRPFARQSFAGVANNGTLSRAVVFSSTGEVTVFRGSDNSSDISGVKFSAVH